MNYRAGDCGLDSLCRREVSTGSAVARHPEPGDLRDPDAYQPAQEPPERLLPASGITCGPRIPPRAHFWRAPHATRKVCAAMAWARSRRQIGRSALRVGAAVNGAWYVACCC